MVGRVNGAAEDELRSKRFSRNVSAMLETELKLNGFSTDNDETILKQQSAPTSPIDEHEGVYIPVVLDKSSLPNTPDPTQLDNIIESPVLGYLAQSPPTNPQIQKLIATEQIKTPPRQETTPPSPVERKSSISAMAKATEAIGRKMSLRSRRKNSKTQNVIVSQEWKLEDIPRRKNSITGKPAELVPAPRSAIPDFPIPPSTTPLEVKSAGPTVPERNHTSDKSNSPPISPTQFMMRNDSVSEVSTALTPTSMTFDGKNTPPVLPNTASPPIPPRNPHHHSPKPSMTLPRHSPKRSFSEPKSKSSSSTTETSNTQVPHHSSNPSASHFSMSSSRPSTSESKDPPKTPEFQPTYLGISPQLPSIPSPGLLSFEDEMSQMWLRHDRKGSQSSSHKRGPSSSSQTGMFSKVLRHARSTSGDQKLGIHSRQSSKGHSRNTSQVGGFAATILAEAEEEKAALRLQLRKSANQIVELEMKIQDGEKDDVVDKLEGSRDALAGVETEREIALMELKVLLKHRYELEESANFLGVRESCDTILKDFETSLTKLKDGIREQVKEYTSLRTQLVEETGRLRSLRDNYLEEAQQLNKKNDELADLNNDIQRNMDRAPTHTKALSEGRSGFSLFKHKKDSPTAASISSVQSILFKNDLAHPMYFESKKSTEGPINDSPMSKVSDSTIIPDDSTMSKAVVTRVSDQDSMDLPPPPKKVNYWRKNTAKAVKSFKSVWSGETTILVSSPGTTISSPQLISSSSQNGGLNILLPYSQLSPASPYDNHQGEIYKTHSFHPKAFKRWQKCGFCGEKLSGTEVRCVGLSSCYPANNRLRLPMSY
jgi:hypothetical protein